MTTGSLATILRVGVTGGIGSGKTLVCSLFAKSGVPVISADEVAKELLFADKVLRSDMTELLGPSVYRTDGSLDRTFVAAKIFSDRSLQKKVNRLVHPRVESEIQQRFLQLQKTGNAIGIVEAALIYEAGYEKHLDVVIVVDAPEAERIQRVVVRDHSTTEETKKRIAAQMSSELKARKADYIIHNTGSVAELKSSVQFLLIILQHISKRK